MEKLGGEGGGDQHEGRQKIFERGVASKFISGGIFPRHPPPQFDPQSRQSAKLFLKSSELGVPQPLNRRRVCPLGSGGRGTLAGERGVGRVPIPTRGHTLWYSLFIRTLWFDPFKIFKEHPCMGLLPSVSQCTYLYTTT